MLVSGYSGIGKTSLVSELLPNLSERRGFFVSGKFGELLRNKPYSALVHAFSKLIKQLLAQPEEVLSCYRKRLGTALGASGQVITELIPELTHIIGSQPPLPPLEPAERQNRFHLVFQSFIAALLQPERPIILFVDDLQWADIASP